MAANTKDFDYFSKGELPAPMQGAISTGGFDHFSKGELPGGAGLPDPPPVSGALAGAMSPLRGIIGSP